MGRSALHVFAVWFSARSFSSVSASSAATSSIQSTALPWSGFPNFERCLPVAQSLSGKAVWNKIGQACQEASALDILVVGGSETAGVNCDDGLTQLKDCAWGARYKSWLLATCPSSQVNVDNQASGGTTMSSALPVMSTWLARRPDIIFIDFIVNDSFEPQENAKNLIAIYEAFILQARRYEKPVFPAFIITCALEKCAPVRDIIFWVSAVHDVAIVSYYDVAHCAAQLSGETNVNLFWDTSGTHPSWKAHQLIADTLAYVTAMNSVLTSSANATLANADVLATFNTCMSPTSSYMAQSPPTEGITMNAWKLEEDRPGKPGWITYSDSSRIAYDVRFGERPRLMVTWLRSYAGLGNVRMTLNGRSVILPGLWSQAQLHVSQAFMHTFQVQRNELQTNIGLSGVLGFSILPNTNHVLTFETTPDVQIGNSSKFKIISISTC